MLNQHDRGLKRARSLSPNLTSASKQKLKNPRRSLTYFHHVTHHLSFQSSTIGVELTTTAPLNLRQIAQHHDASLGFSIPNSELHRRSYTQTLVHGAHFLLFKKDPPTILLSAFQTPQSTFTDHQTFNAEITKNILFLNLCASEGVK